MDESAASLAIAGRVERLARSVLHAREPLDASAPDLEQHLEYLCYALRARSPALFADYAGESYRGLSGRRLVPQRLRAELLRTYEGLRAELPDVAEAVWPYFERAAGELARAPSGAPGSHVQPGSLADEYLRAALAYDGDAALRAIRAARKTGMSLRDVYLEIIQRAQLEIGRLWQQETVTVAQEHYCSGVAQRVLAELSQGALGAQGRPDVVVACVAGELHELGARMVADFFELEGWNSTYLGAATPPSGVLETLRARRAPLLALSATMTSRIAAVRKVVHAARSTPGLAKLHILVGGRPFQLAPELWRLLGADGSAADAEAAVRAGRELVRAPFVN